MSPFLVESLVKKEEPLRHVVITSGVHLLQHRSLELQLSYDALELVTFEPSQPDGALHQVYWSHCAISEDV